MIVNPATPWATKAAAASRGIMASLMAGQHDASVLGSLTITMDNASGLLAKDHDGAE